ncbi:winged helix-turn-helix domain-containing protein [Streptomyces sp. NBC_01216]|uniref:GntR family transcriptional regulator n=1 Tax=Streptomyces sp. NBC_01216 TaxID=2903778 RepID=UPI002E1659CD|nr:winged helix-turn-helix domain-containing protein [Streptomyces sp. NBC_01216]
MELSPDDPRPAYLQIAAALREQILDGRLEPGSRLPSGRELAKEFGTALMTAQNALRVLRDEGLVSPQQGRGVFVRAPELEADTQVHHAQAPLASQLEAILVELLKVNQRLAAIERRLDDEVHGVVD